MNKRPIAALSLAALLALAPATPALATPPPSGVTQEGGKSWFNLSFDITGEEESFLNHIASWFGRDDDGGEGGSEVAPQSPSNSPIAVPPGQAKERPGKSGDAPGHHKDKWWDKPTPTPTETATPDPTETAEPDPTETAEPEPTETATPPAPGETTGGTGGELANALDVEFTDSAGTESTYHVFAEGLDLTQPVGLLVWTDGTGAFGYENPDADYLLGGEEGMIAVARERNMVLVVPLAPAGGCENCWYQGDTEAKAQWSSELMTEIKGQYDIDLDRIAIGGYSSGAQWTTRHFGPTYAEEQSVDLLLPMAYGSAGDLSGVSEEYAASTWVVFNTGTQDTRGSGGGAYASARDGEQGYTEAGFQVEWEESDTTHDRGGDFGPFAAQNIDEHLLAE